MRFAGIRRSDGQSLWLLEIVPVDAFVHLMLDMNCEDERTLPLLKFGRSCMEKPAGQKPLCLTCDTEFAKVPARFCIIKGSSETHCLVTAQCRDCSRRYTVRQLAQRCIVDGTVEVVAPGGTA
jgi:hypothetical protein